MFSDMSDQAFDIGRDSLIRDAVDQIGITFALGDFFQLLSHLLFQDG